MLEILQLSSGPIAYVNGRVPFPDFVLQVKAPAQLYACACFPFSGMAKVPQHYRNFALALLRAPEMWEDDGDIKKQMELEAHNKAMVETILHKVRAQRALVKAYLAGELCLEDEEEDGAEEQGDPARRRPKWTDAQQRLWNHVCPIVERAVKAAQAEDDDEIEELCREAADDRARMLFADGPPGTGKTFVVHELIRHWHAKGARVLFVLPTGQLASEMRASHPHIDVDTYHGGLWLHRDISETLGIMTQYDLVVLDEVSMLTDAQFERVVAMWRAADKLPCLLMLGDFWQLPIVDRQARRCEESCLWSPSVKVVRFSEQIRCKDPALQKKLDCLRTAVPSKRQCNKIKRHHRAWKQFEPSPWDILELFRKHPDTTIVACTRRGAALINDLATQVLFEDRHKTPLGTLGLDYQGNESNYVEEGGQTKLKDGPLQPCVTEVYEGQRVFLTRNMDKENGFVNGMPAVIESYDSGSQCLVVVTKLGTTLAVHKCTEEVEDSRHRVTCFPVRLGYATTVQKIQGATLPHVTIWLDRPGCKASAYVAMSRVQHDKDYLIGGDPKPKYFVPAH